MKNRSILLAIGIAAALFSFRAGLRIDPDIIDIQGPGLLPEVSRVIAVRDSAAPQRVRLAGMIREVTAYNVGIPEQTSANPCIGASGQDLCRLVEAGRRVCAANFVALGTVLRIDRYGECVVLDRMHRRYPHRVDIAMREDEVGEAVNFGVRKLVVQVKN